MTETEKNEFLIESLWILEASSGICIFEENYVDFTVEGVSTDLIASFLSALLTFAGEAFTEEIQHVKFTNRKIYFQFSEYVLFVIAVNDNERYKDSQIIKIKNKIAKRFYDKYNSVFTNDSWSNNIRIFSDFSEDLKEIVNKEPLKQKFLQPPDIKSHVKKIKKHLAKKRQEFLKQRDNLRKLIFRE